MVGQTSDKVKDDIKEKGLSADDGYDRATWRRMSYRASTPHISWNRMKEKKIQCQLSTPRHNAITA